MIRHKTLRVLVKRVGGEPKIETWDYCWDQASDPQQARSNRAEAMLGPCRSLVGGWIESLPVGDGIVLICNEEGLLRGLPRNSNGIVGNFFFAKVRRGWYESLSDKECERCREWIARDVPVRDLVAQARAARQKSATKE